MPKHLPFLAFVIYFITVVFTVGPAFSADTYRIKLTNGETIVVQHYEFQGESIILYKPWGIISFNRSEVAKIEKEASTQSITDDTPEKPLQNKEPRKFKSKGEKPKDDQDTEYARCQQRLKMSRSSMKIYCSQADSAVIVPPPNLPHANRSRVSAKTADQFKAHVQSKADSYKAQRSCNYYKGLVAELEKKCSEY